MSHLPKNLRDAWTPLKPPPNGLQRLRRALDEDAQRQPLAFGWLVRSAALAALILAIIAGLWVVLGGEPPARQQVAFVIVEQATPAQTPPISALKVDPLWGASVALPPSALNPRPSSPLLPVELGDEAVAFYWAESAL